MGELRFIKVQEDDIKALKEIYTYYIENTTATFHIGDISDKKMHDILFHDDDRYKSFKIESGGNIEGYVLLCPYKTRQAYNRSAEVTIYLRKESAGKGIGIKALTFIESIAAEEGIKALLGIICGENTASIRAFEKVGYEKVGFLKGVGEKFGRILDIAIYEKYIG